MYELPSRKGDCGGLSFATGPNHQGKIVSMHVAGNASGQGYGSIITRELIESCLSSLEDVTQSISLPRDMDEPVILDEADEFQSKFEILDVVTEHLPRAPTKSGFTRSKLYAAYDHAEYALAYLNRGTNLEGNLVNPMHLARMKYSNPRVYLDPKLARSVVKEAFAFLNNNSVHNQCRKVYDFETAVQGDPEQPLFMGIPRSTSAGYPYNTSLYPDVNSGKKAFFGPEGPYEFTSKLARDLKTKVLFHEANAKMGFRGYHLYSDFLKDERRPIAKVMDVKTRMISCSPIELTILTRMYFMDFSIWFMKNRILNGACVGINVYSDEWTKLARHLNSKGPGINDGDFENFDGSLLASVVRFYGDEINNWYDDGPENALVRHVLLAEIAYSIHLNGKHVLSWNGKMPSGSSLTAIMNCLFNMFSFRYAFRKVMQRPYNSEFSHYKFDDVCYLAVFGDDNALNTSNVVHKAFNAVSIAQELRVIGMKYTNAKKSNELSETYSDITQISFLKRGFVWDDFYNRYFAPLEIEALMEIPAWVTKGINETEFARDNVDTCLKELALHSEEIYKKHSVPLIKASTNVLNYTPAYTSWDELRQESLGRLGNL